MEGNERLFAVETGIGLEQPLLQALVAGEGFTIGALLRIEEHIGTYEAAQSFGEDSIDLVVCNEVFC